MAKRLLLILGLALSMAAITALPLLKAKQEPAQPNTLRWHAEKALAEGKHQTSIYPPISDYMGADNTPEEILGHANVVVAQVVDSHTGTYGDMDIVTWYKFKVVETLSEGKPCPRCPDLDHPDELLPVNEDEFVLARNSGTATIDGVEISVAALTPPFSKDKNYLFFLNRTPKRTASLLVGPDAVFTVSPEGALAPFSERERAHRFQKVITQQFDASLERLRQHLQQSKES